MNYYWVVLGLIVAVVLLVRWRSLGRKYLLVIWLAGAVALTVVFCIDVYLAGGSLNTGEVRRLIALIFGVSTFVSGALIVSTGLVMNRVLGGIAFFQQASADEMNDFVSLVPVGELEDKRGLSDVPWRYEDLLATHAAALDKVRFHPYHTFLMNGRNSRDPRQIRQSRVYLRRLQRVPNVLPMALIGAEEVLAKLGELTSAQLSAIEACQRINLRRVRQHLIIDELSWVSLAAVIPLIVGLISMIEKVGQVVGFKWPEVWSSITATGVSRFNWLIIFFFTAVIVVSVPLNRIIFRPPLRRLQAFDDMLTIAKAYRQEQDKKA